jgi:hypothetical protein
MVDGTVRNFPRGQTPKNAVFAGSDQRFGHRDQVVFALEHRFQDSPIGSEGPCRYRFQRRF